MDTRRKRLIEYVQEGMSVLDRQGETVGKVNPVFPSAYAFLPQREAIMFLDLDDRLLPDAMRMLFPAQRFITNQVSWPDPGY